MNIKVKCPNCGKPVGWTNHEKCRPFCSERCRLCDLGAWANEEYAVAGESLATNEDEFGVFSHEE